LYREINRAFQGNGTIRNDEISDVLLCEKFGITMDQLDMMSYEEVLLRSIVENRRAAYQGVN
jgi:hypothetical protein